MLVSPHRTQRPWQGATEHTSVAERPAYDPECYLCPGNIRAGGAKNPAYTHTFVFENDFAALKRDVSRERIDLLGKGLFVAQGEPGICCVMCFSPRHDLSLSSLPVSEMEEVIRGWTKQSRELGTIAGMNHVQIFENRGELMGASNPHPHCQIWASASIPLAPARELATQSKYLSERNACLLCDCLQIEQDQKLRIVCENADFIALVPFWAVWPFEILLCSRRHLGAFPEFMENEITSLAKILKQIVSGYDRVFDVPFPYSMGFHQSPCDDEKHPEWHFHAHFYPPLLRSATVRKFMVGFEMLGTPQRDITPEVAAERLRSLCTEQS